MEPLEQLVTFLEQAAPMVWQTLVKQVYLEAANNVLGAVVFVGMASALAWYIKRLYSLDNTDEDYAEMEKIFGALIIVFLLLVALTMLTQAAMMLINPHYYAIQSVLGGG